MLMMKTIKKQCQNCNRPIPKNRRIFCSKDCSWRFYKIKNKDKIYKQWREYYDRRKKNDPNWLKLTYEKRKVSEPNYWENRKKYSQLSRGYLRKEVLNHYGNKCACCAEETKEFLTIDHINGGGGKHRKEINGHVYRWLKKNNFPDGFRLLCYNCNCARGFYGVCPHEK